MARQEYEITINKGIDGAKDIVDKIMGRMNFKMNYTNTYEMIAKRGSTFAAGFTGPLVKDFIPLKLKFSFNSENANRTTVVLSDVGSGFGKAVSFTGDASKRAINEVHTTLMEEISREGS
ncbi:MAG: hypothetical protein FWG14_00670 [Peptococcaceae bacterium]|nr:hypothetical protein [Peptococcaceae bacterium]